jgi:hypothetical protein
MRTCAPTRGTSALQQTRLRHGILPSHMPQTDQPKGGHEHALEEWCINPDTTCKG